MPSCATGGCQGYQAECTSSKAAATTAASATNATPVAPTDIDIDADVVFQREFDRPHPAQ
jgi:hypothetical protein